MRVCVHAWARVSACVRVCASLCVCVCVCVCVCACVCRCEWGFGLVRVASVDQLFIKGDICRRERSSAAQGYYLWARNSLNCLYSSQEYE